MTVSARDVAKNCQLCANILTAKALTINRERKIQCDPRFGHLPISSNIAV